MQHLDYFYSNRYSFASYMSAQKVPILFTLVTLQNPWHLSVGSHIPKRPKIGALPQLQSPSWHTASLIQFLCATQRSFTSSHDVNCFVHVSNKHFNDFSLAGEKFSVNLFKFFSLFQAQPESHPAKFPITAQTIAYHSWQEERSDVKGLLIYSPEGFPWGTSHYLWLSCLHQRRNRQQPKTFWKRPVASGFVVTW